MKSWTWADIPKGHKAPPDLTYQTQRDDSKLCLAKHPDYRWVCTRRRLHTRRHAAGNGHHIVAVWP